MPDQAIILYGPPASGKDTITACLTAAHPQYRLCRRLKCGPGRTDGYRMISRGQLGDVRARGDAVWETRRYGATYVIDRPWIERMLGGGEIPVLHLGEPAGVAAVTRAFPGADVVVAALECPRDIALERIEARQTGDTATRLAAYDATPSLASADVRIDTSVVSARDAATIIHHLVLAPAGQAPR